MFLKGAAVWVALMSATVAQAECRDDRVELKGEFGQISFSVELADTPQERSQGLMFRESMPRGAGMLFVYEYPQRAAFWMKNTLIPLDMLFIEEDGEITHIHENAIPGDLTAIPGGDQVFAVLEINGGLSRQYGISVGDALRHKVFSNSSPIWPC